MDPMSADDSPDTSAAPDPVEETKRKFKQALDAKKGRQGEDHVDGGPQQGHAHGPVEAKRVFRRKTG
jgi:Family of unknown function (DUF5302)